MQYNRKKKTNLKKSSKLKVILILAMVILQLFTFSTFTMATQMEIPGNLYELPNNSKFVIEEKFASGSSDIGRLTIAGEFDLLGDEDGLLKYQVYKGNLTISYRLNKELFEQPEEEWHLIDDKGKKINNSNLSKKINSGALILQTSLDGESWSEDMIQSDIFSEGNNLDSFYITKNLQLQNGCYYRVTVAYKMRRRLEDKKLLFLNTSKYEYKEMVEVYNFYGENKKLEASPQTTPLKKLGSKINTGKDNGYSDNLPIDKNDPHYGWDLGYFYINGYTRETLSNDNIPVFLKNVGDKVSLWFHLFEDINNLRGNKYLTINEDKNGYDRMLEVDQTNFKQGTLIIRYINPQGEVGQPTIYTDYLAANTRTGADTKVQLFEEGDYLVSLNYEIKSMGGPLNKVPTYNNYKIMFEFQIRNGNSMVYPFDIKTGDELSDNGITENGFKLDMAKSKYLNIDVQKSILVSGPDGNLTEDVRFNRPAKDGEEYLAEGIYNFHVSNQYTDQTTSKTIYVGSNNYLRALATSGMSIDELNLEIQDGSKINDDGSLEKISTLLEKPEQESNLNDKEEGKKKHNINQRIIIVSSILLIIIFFLMFRFISKLKKREDD